MKKVIDIDAFMRERERTPVIDVRSPAEYAFGHIPGANSIPLFDDAERARVGTVYKQEGRDAAIRVGLEIVGPKMASFVTRAGEIAPGAGGRVLVHCWRGGMRSEAFAWLLNFAGIDAVTLEGGYKSYRRFIREGFTRRHAIIILGGMTGSGKTEILRCLRELGEQVLDLEGLASHKGSAFGALGQGEQPANEQFENDAAEVWRAFDPARPVWIEDESRRVGRLTVNEPLFDQMRESPVVKIDVPKEIRIRRLVREYAGFDPAGLIEAVDRIQKKLGLRDAELIMERIRTGDFHGAIDLVLSYYDKTYEYGIQKRPPERVHSIPFDRDDPMEQARALIAFRRQCGL